ncbi:LysE family translocator [Tropicibacter naphthalenivorans]|uniref:Leucine efflux protein n=1 Tax=Tropicibacter naphthalenivorans TaxID=441103 RepID=A0A0P1G062_9RHOB|nr:LysE family translocator [Tropicibacter naphthalenivorans]CUH75070.1 Leucine efflux protein [Tropicibacter naphthalenivorans]SMC46965.1 Threonine/homoserine/homoserine lactone efflux protein [Tropicibacter naphthalenivorans]
MIVDPIVLATFIPAALALNVTPGPDMLFCLAQGLRGGPRSGWAASFGITAGGMVHALIAGLGLSALITAMPGAFEVIRYLGVCYLLYIAYKTLRTPFGGQDAPPVSVKRAMRDGFIVNLTNPKFILFILAFLPQFVDVSRPVLPQFLLLGVVIGIGGFLINGLVGQFAGRLKSKLTHGGGTERVMRWLTASLFGGLALRLAV